MIGVASKNAKRAASLCESPIRRPAGHRRAGTREARDQRERLRRTDEERGRPRDRACDPHIVFLRRLRSATAQPLREEEQHAVRDQEDGGVGRLRKALPQGVLQCEPEDARPESSPPRAANRASRLRRPDRCRGRAATAPAPSRSAPSPARRTRAARSPSRGASRRGRSGSTGRSGGCSSRAASAGSRCAPGSRSGTAPRTLGGARARSPARRRSARQRSRRRRALRPRPEPREHETRETDEERRDAVLRMVVAGARLVPGEEAGQRLRRLDPVDDRDHDQDDSRCDGEQGDEPVVPHEARGYASGDGRRARSPNRNPPFTTFLGRWTPRDRHEATAFCGAGSPAVPEPRAVPARPDRGACSTSPPTRPSRCSSASSSAGSSRRSSTSSSWCGSRASRTRSSRERRCAHRTAAPLSRPSARSASACSRSTTAQTRLWHESLRPALAADGILARHDRRRDRRGARRARARVPSPDPPRADAARGRPGPAVPVHLGPLAQPRPARARPGDGRGAVRAGQGARRARPVRRRSAPAGCSIPLENVIAHFLDHLFPEMEIVERVGVPAHAGRRHRDLRRRRRPARSRRVGGAQAPVRLGRPRRGVELGLTRTMLGRLQERLGVSTEQIYPVRGVARPRGRLQLHALDRPDLKYEPWIPYTQRRLTHATDDELFEEIAPPRHRRAAPVRLVRDERRGVRPGRRARPERRHAQDDRVPHEPRLGDRTRADQSCRRTASRRCASSS